MSSPSLSMILDTAVDTLSHGRSNAALRNVTSHLWQLRMEEPEDRWVDVIKPFCDAHPLTQILLEDPCTRRAREKPRGYAGDAELIDYIYKQSLPENITRRGMQVLDYTTNAPSGQAVRWRLRHIADSIDAAAERRPGARVLSLACGHLREVEYSRAISSGIVSTLLAIDQDPESLAVVGEHYGHLPNIKRTEGSVRQMFKAGLSEVDFDLAYAAGLYDYLDIRTAQALTRRLFDALAPGGRLIVPNFLATNSDRGYMESFMEWNLVVRGRAEIESIGAMLPESGLRSVRYFEDPYGVIGYLEVEKL